MELFVLSIKGQFGLIAHLLALVGKLIAVLIFASHLS